MKCLFVSDFHGNKNRYSSLYKIIEKEIPEAVFIGGDILPNALTKNIERFVEKTIFENIKNKSIGKW